MIGTFAPSNLRQAYDIRLCEGISRRRKQCSNILDRSILNMGNELAPTVTVTVRRVLLTTCRRASRALLSCGEKRLSTVRVVSIIPFLRCVNKPVIVTSQQESAVATRGSSLCLLPRRHTTQCSFFPYIPRRGEMCCPRTNRYDLAFTICCSFLVNCVTGRHRRR